MMSMIPYSHLLSSPTPRDMLRFPDEHFETCFFFFFFFFLGVDKVEKKSKPRLERLTMSGYGA